MQNDGKFTLIFQKYAAVFFLYKSLFILLKIYKSFNMKKYENFVSAMCLKVKTIFI